MLNYHHKKAMETSKAMTPPIVSPEATLRAGEGDREVHAVEPFGQNGFFWGDVVNLVLLKVIFIFGPTKGLLFLFGLLKQIQVK